jgi:hypothetical protein
MALDQLDQYFDRGLEATRNTRGGLASRFPEKEAAQHTQQNREKQGINIENGEIDDFRLWLGLPMRQMVNDVFTGRWRLFFCGHCLLFNLLYVSGASTAPTNTP